MNDIAIVFIMNEFFEKADFGYLLEQMGEIGLETRVGRELTRKKNGTYFLENSIRALTYPQFASKRN
jgi:hypothetical protein